MGYSKINIMTPTYVEVNGDFMKEVYIIGLHKTRELTEYIEDNIDFDTDSIWTLNDWYRHYDNFTPDRVFQVHSQEILDRREDNKVRYINWRRRYNESGARIVTPENLSFVENVEPYPIRIVDRWGPEIFTSSLAYILAYAEYYLYKNITLLGFRMENTSEYMHQLPAVIKIINSLREDGFYVSAPLDEKHWCYVEESKYTPSYIYNLDVLEKYA